MLAVFRAKRGWPRALALLILFAFTAGMLHVHSSGSAQAHAGIASVEQGHDHDGHSGPSVTPHCAFCAVVAGKFYVPADGLTMTAQPMTRVTFSFQRPHPTSAALSDLFRPPIALAG